MTMPAETGTAVVFVLALAMVLGVALGLCAGFVIWGLA